MLYVVYYHRHPETNEIVYIGLGREPGRAYDIRSRKWKHKLWICRLLKKHYELNEIVSFWSNNLNKREAIDHEHEMIRQWNPRFNIKR